PRAVRQTTLHQQGESDVNRHVIFLDDACDLLILILGRLSIGKRAGSKKDKNSKEGKKGTAGGEWGMGNGGWNIAFPPPLPAPHSPLPFCFSLHSHSCHLCSIKRTIK